LIAANNPDLSSWSYDPRGILTISSSEGGTVTVSSGEHQPFTPIPDGPYMCVCG